MTDGFGATWKSIVGNLPAEPINVIWEDTKNPELLFVGNNGGAFVSIDRETSWVKMNNNMPDISVTNLVVHPREQDLILGSYGRGIWIMNIAPLQQLTASVLTEDVHLFTVLPTTQRVPWSFGANDYRFGQRHLQTPNDPDGMSIYYYLKSGVASRPATIVIADSAGPEVARLTGATSAGINRVVWNTRVGNAGNRGAGGVVAAAAGRGGRGVGAGTVTGPAGIRANPIVRTIGWSLNGPTPHVIRKRRAITASPKTSPPPATPSPVARDTRSAPRGEP